MALDPNRWTLKTQEAFQAAVELARARNHPEVTPAHLLHALLGQEGGVVLAVLQRVGVAPMVLRNRLEDELAKVPRAYGGGEPQLSRETRDALEAADRERTELHDEYLSTEHLLLALAGKLDPVIGRDEEIRRVIQVLSRRTKNNPVLIGEPGVGKTAIVEGLA